MGALDDPGEWFREYWDVGQPVGLRASSTFHHVHGVDRIWAAVGEEGLEIKMGGLSQLVWSTFNLGIGRSIHAPAKSEAVRTPTKTKMSYLSVLSSRRKAGTRTTVNMLPTGNLRDPKPKPNRCRNDRPAPQTQ